LSCEQHVGRGLVNLLTNLLTKRWRHRTMDGETTRITCSYLVCTHNMTSCARHSNWNSPEVQLNLTCLPHFYCNCALTYCMYPKCSESASTSQKHIYRGSHSSPTWRKDEQHCARLIPSACKAEIVHNPCHTLPSRRFGRWIIFGTD
jgi:hypothetical protein